VKRDRMMELQRLVDKIIEKHPCVARLRMKVIYDDFFRTQTPRELALRMRETLKKVTAALDEDNVKSAQINLGITLGIMWWLHISSPVLDNFWKRMGWAWQEIEPILGAENEWE